MKIKLIYNMIIKFTKQTIPAFIYSKTRYKNDLFNLEINENWTNLSLPQIAE